MPKIVNIKLYGFSVKAAEILHDEILEIFKKTPYVDNIVVTAASVREKIKEDQFIKINGASPEQAGEIAEMLRPFEIPIYHP